MLTYNFTNISSQICAKAETGEVVVRTRLFGKTSYRYAAFGSVMLVAVNRKRVEYVGGYEWYDCC